LNGEYIQGPAPRSLDRFKVIIEDESGNVISETASGEPVALPENPDAVIKVDTGTKFIGKTHA
jgi:cytochrome b6-f complex iron-sulfur subunit